MYNGFIPVTLGMYMYKNYIIDFIFSMEGF